MAGITLPDDAAVVFEDVWKRYPPPREPHRIVGPSRV